jgi:CspA family cold shock protein
MDRVTGTVVWWSDDEGWGALRSDQLPSEVFVHFSELEMNGFRTLQEGRAVQFDVEHYPAGQDGYVYRAHNVRSAVSPGPTSSRGAR